MLQQHFHVFRNTPFGLETLLQSAHFCAQSGAELVVYIPSHPQFLMYFESNIATLDLDRSFLRDPGNAEQHVGRILDPLDLDYSLFEPAHFTAKTLPEIPTSFNSMTCPRSLTNLSTKIGLGFIGPRVRNIVINAPFPILIAEAVSRQWSNILCFLGGSKNSLQALRQASALSDKSGLPLRLFTQGEGKTQADLESAIKQAGLAGVLERCQEWLFFKSGEFRSNLYEVPYDALTVAGSYGHGLARDLLFGSKLELIQTILPNPILLVGPHCKGSH